MKTFKNIIGILIIICVIAFVLFLIFISIEKKPTVETNSNVADFHKNVSAKDNSMCDNNDNVFEFDYKNHHYIWFQKSKQSGSKSYGYAGVVHDPDCKCHSNGNSDTDE